jgi:phosphatidylglycerol:prolipoprotein diacylglycerol transferase
VTVYPFAIHLGSFVVTGYGLMMMVAYLLAGWIFARELARAGYAPDIAWDCVVWAVVGGIAGAKIYYALLVGSWGALISRGGLVWYGGFAGGAGAILLYLWWKRHPILPIGDLIAPPLAAGYALGRAGCFLVGDDYGLPTTLPWGVRFPQGSPPTTARVLREEFGVAVPADVTPETVLAVHPTQLYEVALATVIFVLLWKLGRRRRPTGWVLGWWGMLMGLERAAVELLRAKDDRFFGPLTLAQLLSLGVVAAGAALVSAARRRAAVPEPMAAP